MVPGEEYCESFEGVDGLPRKSLFSFWRRTWPVVNIQVMGVHDYKIHYRSVGDQMVTMCFIRTQIFAVRIGPDQVTFLVTDRDGLPQHIRLVLNQLVTLA